MARLTLRPAFQSTFLLLDNQSVKTFSSMDKVDSLSIVARRDRGILSAQDLRGKKIGTLPKTNADFFLSRYFKLQGMSKTDVTYVDIGTLQQSVDAVVSGRVDAVISFPPFDKMAQEQLANNTTVFPVQSRQFVQVLLVCDNDWLRVHSNISERLLKVIDQADEYIAQHP
jgi:ABC-type nitrate/sulfonate/bicarbonate transport system substrate-binding protein